MAAAPLASRIFDANGEVLLLDVRGLGGVALQLSGTFTLTVQFEATVDGQTWVSLRMLPSNSTSAATNATAAGAWSANVAGFKLLRARVSAFTSGSADATFLASSASGRVGASGGDAETLDGEDGSYYLDVDNMTAGTLAVNRGGTGAATHTSGNYLKGAGTGAITSATAASTFADVSPLTTRGDVLYASSATVTGTRLAVGDADTHLGSDGTDVAWEADPTFATLSPLTTRGDVLVGTSGTATGTRLAVGSANQHLGTDGTDVAWEADPTFATLSPLTTRGDVLIGTSGTATGARLGVGDADQVLTSDGTDVAWAAAGGGGGGKILQVVYGVSTTLKASTSSTFADTDLTASITPADDDNKILVLVSHNGCGKVTTNTRLHTKLLRDATSIAVESTQAFTGSTATMYTGSSSWCVLDDPQTDSEIVYKTQYMSQDDTGTVYVGLNGGTSTMVLLEVDV